MSLTEVINKTTDIVKKYANEVHLKNSNFQQIIHLIDTDGTYIPDDCVVKDDIHVNPFYTHKSILTKYPQEIILRNKAKKEKMNRLYQQEKIWDIPYQCYYMSCNLDHVLYDKQNPSCIDRKEIEFEKISDALEFAELYMDRPIECADFFMKSPFSVCDDFIQSWRFIQVGTHSLERYTNLGIALKDIISTYKNSLK